jgi:two-component system cell cycle response regulator DivK
MKRILIVEDNPSHLRLASLLIKRAGYEPLGAADAAEGLRLAREKRPDLILMDIQLPDMDGLAATRQLKQDVITHEIPVIAVSSYLSEYSDAETRAAGCAAFIAKPYHHAELLAAFKALLGE